MNKKFLANLLAILMIASMVLAACTTTPTQAPNNEIPIETDAPAAATEEAPAATEEVAAGPYEDVDPTGQTISFWHQHTSGREEALNKIVEDFNASNEWGITVVAEYQGSYNDIFNKMLGVLNTPDAPALVVAYQNQAATYQLGEGLVDMTPMVDSPKWGLPADEQADFFPGFWQQDIFPTFGNARLGFPPNRSMEVLYYNMDWLKELGYDAPPATPEEFKEMACKAKDTPFSKATVDGSAGYELSVDASRFASWTFAFGGDIYDYNANTFTYDSEAAVAAMTFLQEMFAEGCAVQVTEQYGDQTDFGTGKLLFSIGSSSGLPFYRQAAEEGAQFEWSVAAIPHTTPDPVMNVYGASVSIPVTNPEQQLAAWLFLKYYTSADIQADWAVASEYFPVRASVADGLADFFAENPAYKTAFDMLQFGHFEPPVPGYDFVRTKVSEVMAAISEGDDVATALAALNEEANVILAEQAAAPLPTPVPTKPPEPTKAPVVVGTADHPIKVLFVPSVEANVITTGGEVMAEALKEATGLEFEVTVPASYAATIEEMCASPSDTMAFIPAFGYVLGNDLCGIDVAFKAVRRGWGVYWTMFVVARDSDIQSIEDLEGKKWAYGDTGSTSGYLVPKVMLEEAGITVGEEVAAGGHPQAVRAVYTGEVDFATAFYSPWAAPEGSDPWDIGMDPEVPVDVETCALNDDKSQLLCEGYRVLDARANIREEFPDVVQKVRILSLSPEIPNDTLSFGPEFPEDLRAQIEEALAAFAETEAWGTSIGSEDFYGWSGIQPATDAEYDFIRQMVVTAGITLETLK